MKQTIRTGLHALVIVSGLCLSGCAQADTNAPAEPPEFRRSAAAKGLFVVSPTELIFIPGAIFEAESEPYGVLPALSVDVNTGKVKEIHNFGFGFIDGLSDRAHKRAFFGFTVSRSLVGTDDKTAVRTFTAGNTKLVDYPNPQMDDQSFYCASYFLPTSSGRQLAFVFLRTEYPGGTIVHKEGVPYWMSMPTHHEIAWLDITLRKVKHLGIVGRPLIWSQDEKALLALTSEGIVSVNVADLQQTVVSERKDVGLAFWSETLAETVALIYGQDEPTLNIVDADFKVVRQICKLPQDIGNYAVTLDGKHIAIMNHDASYGVVDLTTGKYTALGDVKGDLGPEWLDEETIAVGNAYGSITLFDLKGKVKKTIKIPGLRESLEESQQGGKE